MNDKITKYQLIYTQALELYRSLQEEGNFRVRRAEMRSGECAALPIDFCADLQIKASRALHSDSYAWLAWQCILNNPEQYPFLLEGIRENLGKAFHEGDLGANGAYRSLYARQGKDNE